jgi:hypothetical protein
LQPGEKKTIAAADKAIKTAAANRGCSQSDGE